MLNEALEKNKKQMNGKTEGVSGVSNRIINKSECHICSYVSTHQSSLELN